MKIILLLLATMTPDGEFKAAAIRYPSVEECQKGYMDYRSMVIETLPKGTQLSGLCANTGIKTPDAGFVP